MKMLWKLRIRSLALILVLFRYWMFLNETFITTKETLDYDLTNNIIKVVQTIIMVYRRTDFEA